MRIEKILDAVSDAAELNRLNGIVKDGQEGQFLIAAALFGIEDELTQIRKGICYSSDTEIPSLTETTVNTEECMNDIKWSIDRMANTLEEFKRGMCPW